MRSFWWSCFHSIAKQSIAAVSYAGCSVAAGCIELVELVLWTKFSYDMQHNLLPTWVHKGFRVNVVCGLCRKQQRLFTFACSSRNTVLFCSEFGTVEIFLIFLCNMLKQYCACILPRSLMLCYHMYVVQCATYQQPGCAQFGATWKVYSAASRLLSHIYVYII